MFIRKYVTALCASVIFIATPLVAQTNTFEGLNPLPQPVEDNLPLLDSLLSRHQNMHFYRSPNIGHADSVWHRADKKYLYFDTDSICRQFIRKGGYNAIPDEMNYLYYDVFTEMTRERGAVEIDKMEKIAKAYRSETLMREVELLKIANTDSDLHWQVNHLRKLLKIAENRKDTLIQIRIRESIITQLYYNGNYLEAFEEAVHVTNHLDEISEKQYAGANNLIFFIGEMYDIHGYYEKAIPLFERVLKNASYFFERSNLRARVDLGIYYRTKGDLDLSDNYFRSVLESPDSVRWRGEYDAIAIANLAKNCFIRRDYNKAERLLQRSLPVMINFDPPFSVDIYLHLGNCYLYKGNLRETKAMIDSAQALIKSYKPYAGDAWNRDLFALKNKYYALTGNGQKSVAFTDSVMNHYMDYMKKYNVSYVFHAEKEAADAEKQAKERQLAVERMEKEKYRNTLLFSLAIIILSAGFYFLYARLRLNKNRALYRQIKEQDRLWEELERMERRTDTDLESSSNLQQQKLVADIRNYLLESRVFMKSDFDRDKLIVALGTNKTYFFEAVKAVIGKTPQEFVNDMRIEEARRMLDDNPKLTVDTIAKNCGLSRSNFYRLFHESYNISPSEYRKMANGAEQFTKNH